MELNKFILLAFEEDGVNNDHTSLACIDKNKTGSAELLIKETGIIAGIETAINIFNFVDPEFKITCFCKDGQKIKNGDIAFKITGSLQNILKTERLVLNIMQRMSGIATETAKYVEQLNGLKTILLDTRKTTPLFREFEKRAVQIGGGKNHRMGLHDMILIKDNHVDAAGGIVNAIAKVQKYVKQLDKKIAIEIETRTLVEVQQVLQSGGVNRIMLDNFSIPQLIEANKMIGKRFETEASGGITFENIRQYAETGVDFISSGSLTHSSKSLDMSLKIINS